MLLRLIAFEIRYHLNQISFRFAAIAFFLLGLVCSGAAFGGPKVFANSPYTLTFVFIVLSLALPILVALLAGSAILRDGDNQMEALIFSTNVTHFNYLVSRFCGLVLAAFLALLPTIAGLILGYALPGRDPAEIGPFRIGIYFWVLTVIILPNILLSAACVFSTAALTRSTPATYISAIFLHILYSMSSMLGKSPLLASSSNRASDSAELASLLEPYGLVGFLDQTRYWAAEDKNLKLIHLEGSFLYNRLFWIGIALLIFTLTYKWFRFRVSNTKHKPAPTTKKPILVDHDYHRVASHPSTITARFVAFRSHTNLSFKSLLLSRPFYILIILWIFFLLTTLTDSLAGNHLGVPLFPSTAILLASVYDQIFFLVPIVIIFFSGELLWMARGRQFDAIVDVTPMPNFIFWAGKTIAMAGLVLTFLLISLLITMVFQALHGTTPIQLNLYLLLVLKAGARLIFLAILAMMVMSFFRHKYVAMMVTFAIVALFTPFLLPTTLGLEHPMLKFGSSPSFELSSMVGTSFHKPATYWFLIYWLGVTGILAILTLQFWKRGKETMLSRWGHGKTKVTILFCFLFLGSGAVIFYHTNIAQTYMSKRSQLNWRAEYERKYESYRDEIVPTVKNAKLVVDLFPELRAYGVTAELEIENQSKDAMHQLLIGIAPEVSDYEIQLQDGERLWVDREFGHALYQLESPMAPGETIHLRYQAKINQSAFQSLDPENYILAKATYVELEKVLPQLGYLANRELEDSKQRRKRDLPSREQDIQEADVPHYRRNRVTFDLLVSTKPGQTVVAPGSLIKDWKTDERHYFHFKSQGPVPVAFNIASAEYASQKTKFKDIEVTYYHHPAQAHNATQILQTAVATLDYATQYFGPYQGRDLKIAALPSFSKKFAGTACPETVFLVEDRAVLLNTSEDSIDATARILAHEIGHQWWGMQINPAETAGVTMLFETLAVYTEMAITEAMRGSQETLKHLRYTNDQYFMIRTFDSMDERPLADVISQPYIYYYKGAHAVYVLREIMGEQSLNAVLHQLLVDFPYPKTVTTDDLLSRLLAAAPPEAQATIHELMKEVVTYELQLDSATEERQEDGRYKVTLQVTAQKLAMDALGKENAMPLNGHLMISLQSNSKTIATENVFFSKTEQQVTIFSQQSADEAILDPRRLKLEAVINDNQAKIQDKTPSADSP